MPNSFLSTFLSALQASCSILLVIFYGVLAAKFNILNASSTRNISKLCINILLPALLITELGSELQYETANRYVPILLWSVTYNVASVGFGYLMVKSFGYPAWTTVALTFNNTTSLPLLLLKSLASTGVLKSISGSNESTNAAVARAQSYFLVCATVGNCLTFVIGPRLMRPAEAEQAYKSTDELDDASSQPARRQSSEHEPLLPKVSPSKSVGHGGTSSVKSRFISIVSDIFNAPTLGALLGFFIGVTPPLHKAFFAPQTDGGIFTPWLTSSLQSVGQSFIALQVLIVGVTLTSSPVNTLPTSLSDITNIVSEPNSNSSSIGDHQVDKTKVSAIKSTLLVLAVRFLFWPFFSILLIFLTAGYTDLLHKEPLLWFALMLMPAGPPAMKLVAMAEACVTVRKSELDQAISSTEDSQAQRDSENAKHSIARTLALSYVCVPLLSVAVVVAVKATEKAMQLKGLR